MAHLRLIAILIVAIVSYVALIETATIRSEELSDKLQRVADDGRAENISTQQALETPEEDYSKRFCYNTPCGWAVYVPFERQIQYFMKNTCACPDDTYKCIRVDDDLSANAYVYRCRQNATEYDIEAPEDAH